MRVEISEGDCLFVVMGGWRSLDWDVEFRRRRGLVWFGDWVKEFGNNDL